MGPHPDSPPLPPPFCSVAQVHYGVERGSCKTASTTYTGAWCQASFCVWGWECEGVTVGAGDGGTAHPGIWRPVQDASAPEPQTHLAAPLAGDRRGTGRSGNSPVWILGLVHPFPPIKSRTRHMIIKKKIPVPLSERPR